MKLKTIRNYLLYSFIMDHDTSHFLDNKKMYFGFLVKNINKKECLFFMLDDNL
jgi:hypothetical protein